MQKNRLSTSFLMVTGFILLVLCAIALPSAAESSRFIVGAVALGSAGLIVVGVLLGGCPRIVFVVRSSENFVDKAERAESPEAQLIATLRIFWPFQRGRRSLQPIAIEGYCRTASQACLDPVIQKQ